MAAGTKIRKTVSAIDGVSEVYIDQATHRITVVGMADPERMVKAIRKTKRIPTIFSHTDPAADGEGEAQGAPPSPAEPPAADAAPPAAAAAAEEEEAAPAEAPAPPENKEAKPAETPAAAMDATVVRTVHDYPYGYGYGHGHHMYQAHPMDDMHGVRYEASPYVAEYGGGGYPPPVQEGRYYSPADQYYPSRAKGDDRNITSIFSEENPNACSIA